MYEYMKRHYIMAQKNQNMYINKVRWIDIINKYAFLGTFLLVIVCTQVGKALYPFRVKVYYLHNIVKIIDKDVKPKPKQLNLLCIVKWNPIPFIEESCSFVLPYVLFVLPLIVILVIYYFEFEDRNQLLDIAYLKHFFFDSV